jgi:hypothetical protein
MNSVDLSWVLALEIALPFVILSIVLTVVILSGRKKYKEAAKQLILSVKSSEEKDKQALLEFQTNKLMIEDKQAKKNAKKILNERKFLVRNLVSGLLDKNVEAISQLNSDLARISSHYHSLEVKLAQVKVSEAPAETEESEDDEALLEDIKGLKSEVKSLKQEVHVTLTTLNNIFKEFSSMFGEDDVPKGQMSVDQIITAMESFASRTPDENVGMNEDTEKQAQDSAVQEKAEPSPPSEDAINSEQQPAEKANEESVQASSDPTADDDEVASLEKQLAENLDFGDDDGVASERDQLDFSIDSAIDDIDSALDGLELDGADEDEDEAEPDWGDAFAESGDKVEEEEPDWGDAFAESGDKMDDKSE